MIGALCVGLALGAATVASYAVPPADDQFQFQTVQTAPAGFVDKGSYYFASESNVFFENFTETPSKLPAFLAVKFDYEEKGVDVPAVDRSKLPNVSASASDFALRSYLVRLAYDVEGQQVSPDYAHLCVFQKVSHVIGCDVQRFEV